MFLNFLEIGNKLVAVAYTAAQQFQIGAFRFRLEKACRCGEKGYVPYCEGGDLEVEREWYRHSSSLHIPYADTGLEIVLPQQLNLFFICEADRTIAQRAFDEIYDQLVEMFHPCSSFKNDRHGPPNMIAACRYLLPEGCFAAVCGASSIDREE